MDLRLCFRFCSVIFKLVFEFLLNAIQILKSSSEALARKCSVNLVKLTGKHLRWSPFFIKLRVLHLRVEY